MSVIATEIVKAVLILGLQELQRQGMTAEQAKAYMIKITEDFYKKDPELIPDTGGE